MKRRIFTLASIALLFAFISCEKPEPEPEPEPVTLTFSGDIVIDLGSTDADVLAFVTASDKSEVSVSGIDYDKVGEQEATFKTGDVTEKKAVKVKANKIAGTYLIAINNETQTMRQGTYEVETTSDYNKLSIKGIPEWFGATEIIFTFDKDGVTTPTITAPVMYVTGSESVPNFSTKFSEIQYTKEGSGYKLVSMKVLNYGEGIQNMFFTVTFSKM
ncbi:MAG: hypothetical protein GX612_08675 [Bacteroidales bacterium]|nr:hypothetical protein [Bacteroidales bacterium]